MQLRHITTLLSIWASGASAQVVRDAGSITRDLATAGAENVSSATPFVVTSAPTTPETDSASEGLMVGAVRVEGAPALPRELFVTVIADYLGKQASTADLQRLAKSVASVARERGYVFATAIVPQQAVDAGVVAVHIDEGDIVAVRVSGSKSARLQRTLDLIVGHGVRREVVERQLLLAGDIPGIELLSTRLAREDIGNVLVVEVRDSRSEGYASVDSYGPGDLGPVRARLRYDFIGLADDGDVFSVQAVSTPVDPRELAYVSARYSANLGTGGTQVAVTGAVGRARLESSGTDSKSTFVSASVSAPLKRANGTSLWANAELGVLRVDGTSNGALDQRDSMAVATAWLYATTRIGRGRLSGAAGITRGFGIDGTTAAGDPLASRPDASGIFTKSFFWADWLQPLGDGIAVKLAANGQLADRPLLAAQEIGLGGPTFGRAFDFYELFGDSGVMTSAELRWRQNKPLGWIDWIEPYAFFDAGYAWNLAGGYGGGDLKSTGGGVRAAIGRLNVSIEAAVPIGSLRARTGNQAPRMNVSIGRKF